MEIIKRANRVVRRVLKKASRMPALKKAGIEYVDPNFIYFPILDSGSVIIDAGCSYEADFSMHMISRHGARAIAVDPTLKHRPALAKLEERNQGKFTHLPFAITAEDGMLTFHEPKTHESGSIMANHLNMGRDESISYEVRAISLPSLLKHIGVDKVDILKLDVEGAEYDLLRKVTKNDLMPFRQIYIEFHHHAVPTYTQEDTLAMVEKIRGFGFESYSLDDHQFLFRRAG